jgi:hypothetical protein
MSRMPIKKQCFSEDATKKRFIYWMNKPGYADIGIEKNDKGWLVTATKPAPQPKSRRAAAA